MNRLKTEYSKIIDWLEALNENKIVPGLERIEELMRHLGNPEKKLEIIMIGGTNAKGSTSFSLNSTFTKAGIEAGCFTSPHLHSVRERIRIGNELISIKECNFVLSKIKNIIEEFGLKPTYFEVLTAAAYYYFHSKEVNYAIMEIGLGGEWDAVNIGQARLAILTTLGLDHVEYLGNKLEDIAKTKSLIVKESTTVVTGWPREYHKFIPECKKLYHGERMVDWLEYTLSFLKLKCAIDLCSIPGRQEVSGEFTLDTAHNPQAIRFLIQKSEEYEKIVIGLLKDKDLKNIISSLPKNSEILACNLKTKRALPNWKLIEICNKYGYKNRKFETVMDAMKYSTGSKTLVTGSFYTISAAREYLELEGHDEL